MSKRLMQKLTALYVLIFLITLSVIHNSVQASEDVYLYDSHIHYNMDMWKILPPKRAIKLLNNASIRRALVSATPTEGAEKLYHEAPDIVIPMLRPYKNWRHRFTWFNDPELKSYLLEQLQRLPYRGFGEFHVFGQDAASQPVKDMIVMARERKLPLHAHTDLQGMRILMKQASDLVVIWAHGGFDVPIETLESFIRSYPALYIDLSYREGLLDEKKELKPVWKELLVKYPQRFLTGMDTYKPGQWVALKENADIARHWLKQLPGNIADDIARNNLLRLFP